MKHHIKVHLGYYFFLIFILVLGVIAISSTLYDKNLQAALVIILSVSYATLGIVHHRENHDLTLKVVLEYTAVSLFAIASIVFLLMGGLVGL